MNSMNSQKEQEVQFLLHHMVKVQLKYQLQLMKHGNENAFMSNFLDENTSTTVYKKGQVISYENDGT